MSKTRKINIGSGNIFYTNSVPMPQAVGGYGVGTTFDNVAFKDLMDGLLYPYQYPSFSSFSISGQATTLECGIAISGNKTFTWTTSNPSNIKPNTISILDITNSQTLASGLSNDGLEIINLSSITKTTTDQSNVWRISALNTKDQSFTKDFTVIWYDPFYYGVGAKGLTVSQVQQLTKSVTSKSNKTLSFSPNNQVYYFAYPASYGQLISILDANGLEIKNDFTIRTVAFTLNGSYFVNPTNVTYYIYEFNNLTTQTNFNITFKFS